MELKYGTVGDLAAEYEFTDLDGSQPVPGATV